MKKPTGSVDPEESTEEAMKKHQQGGLFHHGIISLLLLVGMAVPLSVYGGTTTRVSIASDRTQGNRGSYLPSLSADGRYVAFHSIASNLVSGDTNADFDIFRHSLLGLKPSGLPWLLLLLGQ